MNFDCSIHLWGLTTVAKFKEAYSASMDEFCYTEDAMLNVLNSLEPVTFKNLFEHEIGPIEASFQSANLSYAMTTHCVGTKMAQKVIVWDTVHRQRHVFCIAEGDLKIPEEVLDSPDALQKAFRARELYRGAASLPVAVAESAHDMIEIVAARPELAPFANTDAPVR